MVVTTPFLAPVYVAPGSFKTSKLGGAATPGGSSSPSSSVTSGKSGRALAEAIDETEGQLDRLLEGESCGRLD